MLYEMVTGRPPFVGDDSIAIIGQHLNTPPVSPSWHRPDLPKGLEALILRLLEKDLTKRPASAGEVRQALAAIDLSYPSPQPSPARGEGAGDATLKGGPVDNPLYRRTFVGREHELKQLQAAFDAAISGQGSLAMVVGEPGIGKTALVEQLATYVSLRGGRTLVGHCYEEGSLSLPYLAFVEAMRSYVLAREPDALKSELGTGAADVARIVSEVRDRVQVELRPPGDPEDDRWRLFQSVTSFLRNASNVQPLLIVLEGLHWADRGTLDLLLHIARNLQVADSTGRGARLLIVGTYRDVEVDRSHPLSSVLADLRRVERFQRLPLRGLTIDEVQRMISNIRGQEVSWGRAEMYYRQTEGNPLFIQELLRYLVEEGLVVREGGRYALADASQPEAGVPEGLRDVIGKRLSRLSPECNRLLSVAAVIGRDFNLETLRAVTAVEEEAMLSSLEEAVRVGVLEERSQPGRVLYRFAHAFFRQTLYEEMIAPRRLRLHQEVARALEAQYGSRREDHAAELAEHFAQSTDRADLAKAVEFGELAAQRAMSVYAYAEAASHLERCLAVQEVLDPEDRAKRCDLLLTLGEALLPAGEPKRSAYTVAPAAFALAEALADKRRLARSSLLAINALEEYGGPPINGTSEYRQWASRLDSHALPDTIERVAADWSLARSVLPFGGFRESAERRLRALEGARRLNDNQALFEAVAVFFSYSPASSSQLALQLANEFAERPAHGAKSGTLSQVLSQCSTHFLAAGERARAEQLWRRVAEIADRTQDARSILTTTGHEVTSATLDGRLREAIEAAERQRMSRNDQMGIWIGGNAAHRALVLLGRADEALEKFYGGSNFTADVQRARLQAYVGRIAEAQAALGRLWAGLIERQAELDALGLPNLLSVIDTAVIVGDRQVVALLIDRVAPYASHAFSQGALVAFVPARQLGAAAALLGRAAESRAYYYQALEVCAKIRFRPEIALTRLQLSELLLEHYPDERAEALTHLDFAISEFRDMKMQPSLERALRHRGLLRA